ncbi:hypothetical protein AVEN_215346-1 [Araneus ventricosus]|uniref:Uncharacterized protein n=1 Tax=Araneus ventricosus TaxID=182803 RepID=A0A4Y2BKX1_ARAVE|nr:hypothetical protein AVEN_215346-1 [Araneus ventricosus]
MHEDFLESTSKPSESSSGKNINTEDETECVPMYEDPSESTSRSFESEPSSSYRDTNTEDSKKRVPLKKDYSYYKNRICDVCGGRCANFMVSYIENILEKCGK